MATDTKLRFVELSGCEIRGDGIGMPQGLKKADKAEEAANVFQEAYDQTANGNTPAPISQAFHAVANNIPLPDFGVLDDCCLDAFCPAIADSLPMIGCMIYSYRYYKINAFIAAKRPMSPNKNDCVSCFGCLLILYSTLGCGATCLYHGAICVCYDGNGLWCESDFKRF
mmetsp:Transcript_22369/g.32129  ORF Transcript_22369/g.32129 Transcript_22369/m.32129 type:complete len:169 (+) Transcript_22369:375-881(+)